MRIDRILPFTLILLSASWLTAQNRSPEERFQLLLKKYPAADANKDGTLTREEAQAYREKLLSKRNRPTSSAASNPTHKNVSYGPHDRHVLDLYLAEGDAPTPLIVYIHGGGFVSGNKSTISKRLVEAANSAGISMASIHYRFVSEVPFPAPQIDAARAIQFLRANSKKWNLDKSKFAAYGGSAGAGLSLWLGFHNDMAKPDSDDPVERESTRVIAVGSRGGQTTYDPNLIKAWIGGRAYEHPSIFKCYGIQSIEDINDPKLQPLYDETSAITHLTADDPPVYMIYSEPDMPLPANARPGQGIHHPIFAKKLIEKMDEFGIESVYHHTSNFNGDRDLDMLKYFQKWFENDSTQSE